MRDLHLPKCQEPEVVVRELVHTFNLPHVQREAALERAVVRFVLGGKHGVTLGGGVLFAKWEIVGFGLRQTNRSETGKPKVLAVLS